MSRILLGVTGSVAALKTPGLAAALTQSGYEVKVIATQPSLYFFDRNALPEGMVVTDADEWPQIQKGHIWQRSEPVLHIELRRWAELFLIAPLDANTLAKLAMGLCDNCLTCVWRAWDFSRPVMLAPAMNTLMWDHPQTVSHLRSLAQLHGRVMPLALTSDAAVQWINDQKLPSLKLVGPVAKNLACGDVGQGAMAEVPQIVEAVQDVMRGKR